MRKLPVSLAAALAGLLTAAGACAAVPARLAGDVVPPDGAQRTVVITPDTRWVNVEHDETVKFESKGQEFAFDFDGVYNTSVDLAGIAPQGALDHPVMVYIQPRLDDTDAN